MRSGRLLEILLRLQARSPRTARELAEALNVTQRTIYRDVEALCAADVPIYTIRGARGGISLVEGYRQSISRFSEDEIHAFFVNAFNPLLELGFSDALKPAQEKLYGALSNRQQVLASKLSERVFIEHRPWARGSPPAEILAKLRIALWDDRTIRVTYQDQKGSISRRTVDPIGIVMKAGVWYLVARERLRFLTFRVARVQTLEVLPDRFQRPEGFKLAEHWLRTSQAYESQAIPVAVRIQGSQQEMEKLSVLWPLKMEPAAGGKEPAATVTFPLSGQAVQELLAWSSRIEVLEPASIRREIVQRLESAVKRYQIPS